MIIFREIKNLKFYKLFLLCLFFKVQVFAGILDYDLASYYGQNGQWVQAKDKLKKVFVCKPDDPNVSYDLAVASFETKDFAQAAQYFSAVVDSNKAGDKLKEQALFNLGNTNVKLESLQNAIENYEQALKINPDNVRSKYNLEVVKKMLEQKNNKNNKENKEQDKNQDKDKQEQDKHGEQENKQDSDEQKENKNQEKKTKTGKENKSSGKQENKQHGENSQASDGSENKRDNKSKQQQGRNNNGADSSSDNRGSEGKSSEKKDFENKENGKQNSGQNSNGKQSDKKQEENCERKQNTNHDKNDKVENKKDQAQVGKNGKNNDVKSCESDSEDFGDRPLPAELVKRDGAVKLDNKTIKILNSIDEFDKKNSKEFMRVTVEKNMTGKYGQNLW